MRKGNGKRERESQREKCWQLDIKKEKDETGERKRRVRAKRGRRREKKREVFQGRCRATAS